MKCRPFSSGLNTLTENNAFTPPLNETENWQSSDGEDKIRITATLNFPITLTL